MRNSHRSLLAAMLVLSLSSFGGCDSGAPAGGGASMNEMAKAATAQQEAKESPDTQPATNPAQPPADTKAGKETRKVAEREGVGEGGYYTAIVGARRHVLNRVDDLAWLQGVQHFQAEHGRLPKDHAEFMSRIVEPLGIDLGYKEEGQEFLYDPSQGQWGEVYVVEKLEEPATPAQP